MAGPILLPFALWGSIPATARAQEPAARPLPAGLRFIPDIVFRIQGADTIRLDLLVPADRARMPAILYVGAASGPRRSELLWSQAVHLATLGFVGALMDYRPRAVGTRLPITVAASDAKLAVRWLRAHAREYGIDGSRIGILGASQGGLVAALAGLPNWVGVGSNANVRYSDGIGAVALLEAPLDLADSALSATTQRFLGEAVSAGGAADSERDRRMRERFSPVTYFGGGATRDVREHVPPFLLLHGTADEEVPYLHSDRLARELRAQGLIADLFAPEGARHGFVRTPEWRAKTLTVLGEFFRRMLMDTVYRARWYDSRPVWSPDGAHIAFHSDHGGEMGVWIMRPDGSELRRIASGNEPSWSPDGLTLAFESGEGRLASVKVDGSGFALLTRDTTEFVYGVSWSPDGAHIAFSNWADSQLHVFRLADGQTRRLTNTTGGNGCSSWFPDGSRLAFHSSREGQAELYAVTVGGEDLEQLTDSPTHEFCPAVSPDGRRVAFQRRATTVHQRIDLYVRELNGSGEINLTNHFANDRWASWSPDGEWIAFASTRGGNSDIYTIRADGTELRRLTHR